jgi:antitoxin component of MazEF toxin-antitoxin module
MGHIGLHGLIENPYIIKVLTKVMRVERKAISLGSSLALCLPKIWVENADVKPKDSLMIEISDDTLVIRRKKDKENKK